MKRNWLTGSLALLLLSCGEGNVKKEQSSGHDHHAHGSMMSHSRSDYADSVNRGLIPEDTLKGSPLRAAMADIGACHVHIEYSSPGVKGRTIWGGLVQYGQVWVSGAHQATAIDFNTDVTILGKSIPKGTYAFFTIPGKNSWTVILNKRFNQHLADEYDEKEDIARFEVAPRQTASPVQRLTYTVTANSDTSGVVALAWENIEIQLPVAAQKK